MKEFNKILYDILLKLDLSQKDEKIIINNSLINNYFRDLTTQKLLIWHYLLIILQDFLNFVLNYLLIMC